MKQLGAAEAIICVIASQIANVGESIIGAVLQEKEGFRWVGSPSDYYLVHEMLGFVCYSKETISQFELWTN